MRRVDRRVLAAFGLLAVLVAGLVPESVSATDPAVADLAADPLFGDLDSEIAAGPDGFPDPLEEVNRRTLTLNRFLDRCLLDPVTRLYAQVLPGGIKTSVRSAFLNLALVPGLANHMLQFDGKGAAVTAGRLAVNSTIGILGLLDPATELGLEDRHADFGQTLAKLGIGSGPYFILPALGPTTVRDGIGGIFDMLIHPATFFFGPFLRLTYSGGSGLSLREANYEALKALDESSVDYYAALRNAYYQARMAEIWNGSPPPPRCRRVCRSLEARFARQPWRMPAQCDEALLEPNLAACAERF